MMKAQQKTISALMVLVMVFALGLPVLAGSVDAGDVTTATIKGIAVSNLGINDTNFENISTPGAVTIPSANAADTDGTSVTAFAFSNQKSEPIVKKFAAADTINTTTFDAAPAYNNEAVSDGDVFVVGVSNMFSTGYHIIVVTVSPPPAGGGSAPSGERIITGEGVTQYIDMEIFDVTLPTDKALDYQVDPQGLISIEDGETKTMGELQGGGVYSEGAAVVVNNSSVPITVDVTLTATGDATFLGYGGDDENTLAGVNAGDGENILLYAVPAGVGLVTPETPYVPAAAGYVVEKTTPTVLSFVLDAADYAVTNNAGVYTVAPMPNTGSGTALQIGGRVSTRADWSDYVGDGAPKAVGVKAVFRYAQAKPHEIAAAEVAGVPGLITADADAIDLTP